MVEAQVEAHGVAQQIDPQGVGGLPADAYAQEGGDYRDGEGEGSRSAIGGAPPHQVGQRRPRHRGVDHVAYDQRGQRLGAGAGQQQRPEQRHGAAPVAQVVAQHPEQRRRHGGGGSVGHRSRKVRVSRRPTGNPATGVQRGHHDTRPAHAQEPGLPLGAQFQTSWHDELTDCPGRFKMLQ